MVNMNENVPNYKDITVDQARDMILDNNDSTVVLDVRNPDEYAKGHIKYSMNINVYLYDFKQRAASIPKDKSIIVHCEHGARSKIASNILLMCGFRKVYNMLGGFDEWKKRKF